MICPEYDSTDGFEVTSWFDGKEKPHYSGIYQVQSKVFTQVAFYCWYNTKRSMWLGDLLPNIMTIREYIPFYAVCRPSRYQDYIWRGLVK